MPHHRTLRDANTHRYAAVFKADQQDKDYHYHCKLVVPSKYELCPSSQQNAVHDTLTHTDML